MRILRLILDLLFPLSARQTLVTDATLESLGQHVRPRIVFDTIVALLPYRKPLVRACITSSKFKDSETAQTLLAGVLTDYLNEWSATHTILNKSPLVLVPVPLSATRLKERGYNQVERVARLATKKLSHVYLDTDLLVRTRDTLPQTSLGGFERRRNVVGAFSVSYPPDPSYTYIVLDDVATTGSTVTAAMEALKLAGSAKILGITLAH